jgi:hypothetical protein
MTRTSPWSTNVPNLKDPVSPGSHFSDSLGLETKTTDLLLEFRQFRDILIRDVSALPDCDHWVLQQTFFAGCSVAMAIMEASLDDQSPKGDSAYLAMRRQVFDFGKRAKLGLGGLIPDTEDSI